MDIQAAAVHQAACATWWHQAMGDMRLTAKDIWMFRERFGAAGNDETKPRCSRDDYLNHDPLGYWCKRTQDFLALLEGPENQRIPLGNVRDGICRATCMFHCGSYDAFLETLDLTAVCQNIEDYCDCPDVTVLRQQYQDKYQMSMIEDRYDPPKTVCTYEDYATLTYAVPREVHAMEMTLGLARDVMTYQVTNGALLTYAALINRIAIDTPAAIDG
jgi:hypothetical protein